MTDMQGVAADQPNHMRGELEDRILNVIDEIDKGFSKVMQMYSIAFYFGLGLIALSCGATLILDGNKMALLFGGVGIIDVVAFFIFKPIEDLQRSRGNLAQLASAFITWVNETHNANQFLRKELEKDDSDVHILHEVSKRNVTNTINIMYAIELLVASKMSNESGEEIRRIIRALEGQAEADKVMQPGQERNRESLQHSQ